MIYVMKSPAYKEGTEDKEYEDVIKIGYTGEKSKKSRFDIYITENPTIRVLYLIPEGTERDEKNLHHYFKKLKISKGHEWFKYDQKIIDFFETHKTKESLKEVDDWSRLNRRDLEKAKQNKENNNDKILFIQVAAKLLTPLFNTTESRVSNFLWFNIDKIEEVIETRFPGKLELIKKRLQDIEEEKERMKENELALQQAYDHLLSEFDKDKNFERRMKLLCDTYFEYPEFYTKYANSPLPCMIPIEYQNYINILGFERIRALNYKEAVIIREIETLKNLKNIDIYSLFKPGDKYSTVHIKDLLGNFYKDNNIYKKPKASDLEEYFIMKPVKLKNPETSKWENGFEIVGKK